HRKEAVVGSSTTPGFRRSTAAGGLLFLHLPSRGGTVESLRLSVSGAECGPRLSFATRSGSSVVSYELTAGRGQVAGVEGPPRPERPPTPGPPARPLWSGRNGNVRACRRESSRGSRRGPSHLRRSSGRESDPY